MRRQKEELNQLTSIYFQGVTIWWTKKSRGMPGAKVRTELPQNFSLTSTEIQSLGVGGIHLVTMREEEGFTPHMEVRPLQDKERIKGGAVMVQPIDAGAHLYYRYQPGMGAPNRSHRPSIEFDVAAGQRAR